MKLMRTNLKLAQSILSGLYHIINISNSHELETTNMHHAFSLLLFVVSLVHLDEKIMRMIIPKYYARFKHDKELQFIFILMIESMWISLFMYITYRFPFDLDILSDMALFIVFFKFLFGFLCIINLAFLSK